MRTSLLFSFLICLSFVWANNIQIDNVRLASQNTAQDFYMIEFDLSWENSWRTSTYESNWDAAWVFVKFTPKNERAWEHASLHYVNGQNDGHVMPAGATYRSGPNSSSTQGVGVFIYRDAGGFGPVNYQSVQLRWDYGVDGVSDSDIIELNLYGIEMVYVPQGPFYVGDGSANDNTFEDGNSGQPFRITSEAALTLGGSQAGQLSVTPNAGDDFDYFQTRTLPAAFPKGYNAFYCMKYETSGQQYADFMKTLDPAGMTARYPRILVNSTSRSVIILQNADNGNVSADYPYLPVSCIAWDDMAAYLDWSGLRPLSELEYEKACRGPLEARPDEYAWGNTSWAERPAGTTSNLYVFEDRFGPNEMIAQGMGEGIGNACAFSGLWPIQSFPYTVRCGIYAAGAVNKTRQETGATYYGIMEMSGNVAEFCVGVGNSQTRDFTGRHGDGNLSSSANASFTVLSDWTFVSGTGLVYKEMQISDRGSINTISEGLFVGIRGCRTAP